MMILFLYVLKTFYIKYILFTNYFMKHLSNNLTSIN